MTCLMNASSSSSSWEGARPSGGGAAPRAAHAAPPSKARRNKKEKKSTESSSRRTEERPYSEDQLRQGVLLVLKGLSKGKAAARIGFPSAASTLGRYAAEARKIPLVLAACEANGDDGDDGVLRAHVATITFKERGSPEFNERSMFSTDARGFFVAAIKLFSQLGFPMDAERIRGMMADAVNARLPVDGWRAQVPAEVPARQPERSRVRGCQVVSIILSVRYVTVSRRHVPLQKKDTPRAVLCARTPRDTARMDHHEQVVAQRRVALDREEDGGDGAFLGWPPRAQIPAPWTPARRAGKCIAKRTSRAR